jgi:hypothetical protein
MMFIRLANVGKIEIECAHPDHVSGLHVAPRKRCFPRIPGSGRQVLGPSGIAIENWSSGVSYFSGIMHLS